MRKILIPAAVAALLGLLTASQAHAYGAYSRSATYTNPNTGRSGTVNESGGYGSNGAYREGSASGSGPNGSYSASGARAYSPTTYGSYSATGSYGSGNAAVTRSVTYP